MALEDLKTGLDLFDYVLSFGGQAGGVNDDYATHVKAAIRQAYWDFLQKHSWWFARAARPLTLSIQAKQKVTVQAIAGNVVTLTAALATSQADKKLALESNGVPYIITTHVAGTNQLTLDAAYVETPSAGAAVIFQDEYVLPATCLKPWGPLKSRGLYEHHVDLLLEREWKHRYDWKILAGVGPVESAYVVRGKVDATTGLIAPVVRVAPWGDVAMVLEGEYTEFHDLDFSGNAASDSPKLPRPDRWVLGERALFTLWRNKNNTLADSAELRAQRKEDEMERVHLGMASRDNLYVRHQHSVGAR
jgi:hypothetical protein